MKNGDIEKRNLIIVIVFFAFCILGIFLLMTFNKLEKENDKEKYSHANEYKVVLKIYGNETKTLTTNGHKISRPEDPVLEGYTFFGWYLNEEEFDFEKEITQDIVLEARWGSGSSVEDPNRNYVIITFNTDGGSSISAKQIEKGRKVAKPSNPTKKGYTFIGWYTNSNDEYNFDNSVNSDLTLYAHWKKEESTPEKPNKEYVIVTFQTDGGSKVNSQKVEKGKKAIKPSNPTKKGYTFIGWYTNSNDEYNFDNSVNSDLTLYAHWKQEESTSEKEYVTVTFQTNGGSKVNSQKVEKGKTAAKPSNPTKKGYTFVGWYTSARKEFSFSTKINSNMTLSALWAPTISYTKSTTGKGVFLNNPETIADTRFLADSDLGNTHLYKDFINGKGEIFFSHSLIGSQLQNVYVAFRVYNPSTTKAITVTFNKCGSTYKMWDQYYEGTCNLTGKKYEIPPRGIRYIFYSSSGYVFGEESLITQNKAPKTSGYFMGVLNVTTSDKMEFALLAFKDFKKTYSTTYRGNCNDEVPERNGNTYLPARGYAGYYKGLPEVTNTSTFEIYDETPKGALKVSYANTAGEIKTDSQWITNNVGATINTSNFKITRLYNVQVSDILHMFVPISETQMLETGPYPAYKEIRNLKNPICNYCSILGWPYNIGNWGVHYHENITIKNNSSSAKTVSFTVSNNFISYYYNGKNHDVPESTSETNPATVWRVTIPAKQTKTIPVTLMLRANGFGTVVKKVVLEN